MSKETPRALRVLGTDHAGRRRMIHQACGRRWTETRPVLHCCQCGEYTTAGEFRWHRRHGGTCPTVEAMRGGKAVAGGR